MRRERRGGVAECLSKLGLSGRRLSGSGVLAREMPVLDTARRRLGGVSWGEADARRLSAVLSETLLLPGSGEEDGDGDRDVAPALAPASSAPPPARAAAAIVVLGPRSGYVLCDRDLPLLLFCGSGVTGGS